MKKFQFALIAPAASLALLLSACVVPPHQQQQYPASQPTYSPPPVVIQPTQNINSCHANNQRMHQDTINIYERARQAGRIDPAETQQFNAMQARLNYIGAQVARGGYTLAECQYVSNVLAKDRQEVIRMSRYDPGLRQCQAENLRAHNEVHRVYNDGQRAGRIRPEEAQHFSAMEKRLMRFQADLQRDGLTLAECQEISRAIAREHAIVNNMVR